MKIPNDIAIVGFDDSEWSVLLDTPLTVVQQPVKELAVTSAEILIRKINDGDGKRNPVIHTLDTSLVIRKSSLKQ